MTEAQIDSTILRKFQAGDQAAFNAVYNHFIHRIKYFCFRYIGNKEDAEEVALKAFHKLFQHYANLESEANIKAYLYVAARHACIDYIRSLKRKVEKVPIADEAMIADQTVEISMIEGEILQSIYSAISKLPPACKQVITLLYLKDLTPKEVAATMNISLDNVYSQKKRALKILRLALACAAFITILLFCL